MSEEPMRVPHSRAGKSAFPANGKIPFSLTEEQRASYRYDRPIAITELANRIYALAENDTMEKMCYKHITAWLLEAGLLCQNRTADGKMKRYPTDAGNAIGIYVETKHGSKGTARVVLYNKEAQFYILEHIDVIAAFHQT